MATAVERVFMTPELLEAVLLEVDDMRTLLLSQRVDRTFKAAIDSSINLQRVLWFKPKPSGHSQSQDECELNPLIRTFRQTYLGRRSAITSGWIVTDDDYWRGDNVKNDLDIVVIPRQDGSWRRMLLFQPGEFPHTRIVALPQGTRIKGDVWRLMSFGVHVNRPVHFSTGFLNFGKRSDTATAQKILDDVATYTAGLSHKIDLKSPNLEWCWLEDAENGDFKIWWAALRLGQPARRLVEKER